MKIKIVADSSCDLIKLDGTDFQTVPMKVNTDAREYSDGPELNVAEMVEELRRYRGRSYSSCPSVGEWEAAFEDADCVYAFTISGGISGSYNSAVSAGKIIEEKYPDRRIAVFDSRSAGPEIRLHIEKVRELIQKGMDFAKICFEMAEYKKQTHLFFALQSLHNFAQNGRVSKVAASAAGILGIRVLGEPSAEGTLELLTKCRGEQKTEQTILEEMKKRGYNGGKVRIADCQNSEGAEKLRKAVEKVLGATDVLVYPLRGLCSYYAEKGGILIGFEK